MKINEVPWLCQGTSYFTGDMKSVLLPVLGFLVVSASGQAQQTHTVGLLSIQSELSFAGYNLYYPYNQPNVYLLDACGEIVHSWPGEPQTQPGNSARLLPDGTLMKGVRRNASIGDPIWGGGGGETIEIRSWEDDLIWSFTLNNASYRLHHDFDVMPNGNILMTAWEAKTTEEAIAAGRDPDALIEDALWPDMILEVDPRTDSIVWEWHAWDHIIQDFDAAKLNFGKVAAHPELIDLNYIYYGSVRDWMHTNSIDYHPGLDVILLSVAKFHELWIIDHSITTQEASGHNSGIWGKGGDLIFRWGNPAAYQRGDTSDQKLFFQHDAQWIGDPLDTSYPYFGSIVVFNNRVTTSHSTINILTPVIDTVGREFRITNGRYLPLSFDRTVMHPIPEKMYSPAQSGVQFLPNQNILILAGNNGYAFELTPDASAVVWEYVNPILNGIPVSQGTQIQSNMVFRFNRYPLDYLAFIGKDLTPKGFIELNPDTAFCNLSTAVATVPGTRFPMIRISPNPVVIGESLYAENYYGSPLEVTLTNITGQVLDSFVFEPGENKVRLNNIPPGVCVLTSKYPPASLLLIVQ